MCLCEDGANREEKKAAVEKQSKAQRKDGKRARTSPNDTKDNEKRSAGSSSKALNNLKEIFRQNGAEYIGENEYMNASVEEQVCGTTHGVVHNSLVIQHRYRKYT